MSQCSRRRELKFGRAGVVPALNTRIIQERRTCLIGMSYRHFVTHLLEVEACRFLPNGWDLNPIQVT